MAQFLQFQGPDVLVSSQRSGWGMLTVISANCECQCYHLEFRPYDRELVRENRKFDTI
jgi:hypothetical protein